MKKNQNLYFLVMLMLTFIIFSCNKSEIISSTNPLPNDGLDDSKRNEATWISNDIDGSKGWLIKLKIFIGHTEDQCGGKCIKFFGQCGHMDCRGIGNTCSNVVKVMLYVGEGGIESMLILTEPDAFGNDLEFQFPDRSLFITNPQNSEELWLNIPEQILVRTSSEEPFVLYDIWFSEESELDNL